MKVNTQPDDGASVSPTSRLNALNRRAFDPDMPERAIPATASAVVLHGQAGHFFARGINSRLPASGSLRGLCARNCCHIGEGV
jgi:hypothetical protein